MKRIPFDEMWLELTRVLRAAGFEEDKAKRCAQIFTENTCDGVMSHGLNRFPAFVTNVKMGVVKLHVEPELVRSLGAIEQWDGKQGVGPLNAEIAMNRAIALARGHGIGCVGLRNTNHWMRAGTYGLLAAAGGLYWNLLDEYDRAHAAVGCYREQTWEQSHGGLYPPWRGTYPPGYGHESVLYGQA